jgi:hypothetical protein
VFSVLSLSQIVDETGLQASTFVDMLSCGLTAAGMYLAFTGDAKDWFDA